MEKLLLLKDQSTPKASDKKSTRKGGFGKVWKVQYKKTKETFALKEMSKLKIIDKKSEKSINSEREFLSQLHHPFIVNMHYAFQDKDNLYLVMDMLAGGDLRYHISRYRRFSEEQTRFFIANLVLALEYIHSNNVIHRDIKPENLVLDENGYVRITDFGIAKENLEDNSSETSGTPGYMSPEVMRGKNHSFPVDFFAIGVIGYEFMIGKRPYYGKNRKEIKEQIFSSQASIKKEDLLKGWSTESADFINKLLLRKQENRLGFKNGAKDLKEHQWLKYYPWKELSNKTLPAPFMPENKDNFDKRYCESVDKLTDETKMRYENILCGDAIKKAFVKFYFNKEEIKERKGEFNIEKIEKEIQEKEKEKKEKEKEKEKERDKEKDKESNKVKEGNSTSIVNNYFNNSDKNNFNSNKNNNMKCVAKENVNMCNNNSSTNLSNTKLKKKQIYHSKSEKEIQSSNINEKNIYNINNINNNIINIIDNSNLNYNNENQSNLQNNNQNEVKNNPIKKNYYYVQNKNKNLNKNSSTANYFYNNNIINCNMSNMSHNASSKNISNNNSMINNNSCINNNQFDKLKNTNLFTNLKQTKYLFNCPKSNNIARSSSVINLKNNNHCSNLPSSNIMLNNNSNNNSNYQYYINKLNNNGKIKINYNSNNNSNLLGNNNINNNGNNNATHKKLNRVNSASKILGRSKSDYIIDNNNQKGFISNKNKYVK